MQQPLAKWNSARDVWEIPDSQGLLCEHWGVFSETFPTSITTVAGTLYERRMSVRHMDGSGGSSLLGTPRAEMGSMGSTHVKGRLEMHKAALLPTPDAYSATRGGPQDPEKRREGGHQPTLADVTSAL